MGPSRILVTGSNQGLGLMAGQLLAEQGCSVTLHARNEKRAADARKACPSAERVLVGELSTLASIRSLADQANAAGRFDAIIHNAGVGPDQPRTETVDGLDEIFVVNALAPYLLTALITRPSRLVYLSSGMHRGGEASLADPQWKKRRWDGYQAYSDSKLFDVVLAYAVARLWPGTLSNAVDPGWVATRMGGPSAPDDLAQGPVTQAWLAVSNDPAATVTGRFFFHKAQRPSHPAASEARVQDQFLDCCASLTGVALPRS